MSRGPIRDKDISRGSMREKDMSRGRIRDKDLFRGPIRDQYKGPVRRQNVLETKVDDLQRYWKKIPKNLQTRTKERTWILKGGQ